jgi:hypothetical protein
VSPHTQLAAAVLGAVLTAAAAAYYAWWRGRELHREMDAVLDHLARFENNLIGEPGDPEGGELGRQSRNLERLRLIVAALIPTTSGPPTGPADIPATDGNGDPPQQPSARAYSLTGPRPRPPGAHRRED